LRNVAIVLAGGTGARVGLSIPKQLVKVAGKPIIEHTIGLLNASPLIDEVVVLMTPGHLDAVHDILRPGAYPKVTRVLEGAETRNATTQRAIDALGDEECNVLFHDAVRPLLSQRSSPTASTPWTSTRPSTRPSPPRTRSSRSTRRAGRSTRSSSAGGCAAVRPRRASGCR
jgi:bifunctional N-acetylglucosamine-1-phosphate-uridyltransferase/glucosamine-1-phosphate-acetyltransferase GlmU-like protein